nr:MAG: hypothetical protein [Molluscum contagiosum virus]
MFNSRKVAAARSGERSATLSRRSRRSASSVERHGADYRQHARARAGYEHAILGGCAVAAACACPAQRVALRVEPSPGGLARINPESCLREYAGYYRDVRAECRDQHGALPRAKRARLARVARVPRDPVTPAIECQPVLAAGGQSSRRGREQQLSQVQAR